MESIKIEIEIPKEFEKYMDKSGKDANKRFKEILLYQFIKENKISFGKAAEIMGISKQEFIIELGKMGIPYFDSDIDEVIQDMKNIEDILGER